MTQLHHTGRAALALSLLALALTATGCGSAQKEEEPSVQDSVKVTGDFGEKPTIKIDSPLKVSKTVSWTTVDGKGDKVGAQATMILSLTLANGRTGKTAISTHDGGQPPPELKAEQLFPSLSKALVGQPSGSRVVVASSPDDAYGDAGAPQIGVKKTDSLVIVADVISTDPTSLLDGPTGASNPLPASAPKILEKDGELTGFDFTGLKKPTKYSAIVLREGTGPEIGTPDRIAAKYIGQVWGAKQPFNNTFGKEPANFSIGQSGVIKAWDMGLAGLKEGARVMLICPPGVAYGKTAQGQIPANATLVFVLDVLGVG